jgi:hypothetical protein
MQLKISNLWYVMCGTDVRYIGLYFIFMREWPEYFNILIINYIVKFFSRRKFWSLNMEPKTSPEISVTTTTKGAQHRGRAKKAKLISRSLNHKFWNNGKFLWRENLRTYSSFLLLGKEVLKSSFKLLYTFPQ